MIQIDHAAPAEIPACLVLTPELQGLPAEFLVARRDGRLVGACGIHWTSWSDPAGFPVAVEVIPAARRAGVGRRLLQAAGGLLRGETGGLWSMRPLPVDSPQVRFLSACGFAAKRRQLHYRMQGPAFYAHMARIVERLRRHGHIPDHVRAVPLRAAPLEAVAWLVTAEFGGAPMQLLEDLRRAARGGDHGLDLDISCAVLADERVVGALLCRRPGEEPIIEANVVDPAWRNSFVNALQLATSTRFGLERGDATFRFCFEDDVRDTRNLVSRGNAELISAEVVMYYAIDDAAF